MEKSVQNLPTDYKVKEKNLPSKENKASPERNKFSSEIQKEVNSWDCSTPSENEKSPKDILNDWDSNSDVQETIVQAFDLKGENRNCDDWDFESEKIKSKSETNRPQSLFVASSLDSFCFSNTSFISKTTPNGTLKKQKEFEDDLLVEEFDDRSKNNPNETLDDLKNLHLALSTTSSDSISEKVRKNTTEGTPDDTIWMIPKTERSGSGESTSKLISSSDRESIESQSRFRDFFKKAKSLSDMQKRNVRRKTDRSSRSENLGSQKNNYNTFLRCEGSNQQRKLEIESKDLKENILCREKFHRTRVFFTEVECKAMAVDKDVPEKLTPKSSSTGNTDGEVLPEENVVVSNTKLSTTGSATGKDKNNEQPGFSGAVLDETASSDSSPKIPEEDSHSTEMDMKEIHDNESTSETTMKAEVKESWLLFDEAGKYQQISKTEVSMMFNGRSADAVLQGRTEHLIPTSTLTNSKSLKNLICNFEPKESTQCIMTEEDTGGDDEFKRLIDLERKVENTLFYIRPETDFRASIRIIPVNAEMIHLWKRSRDGGTSNLSFETDMFSLTHGSIDTDLRPNDNTDLISPPNYELLVENENRIRPAATTTNQSSVTALSDVHPSQSTEFSKLLVKTGEVVDTLTSNFRTLQSRVEGESSRSLALEGELSKLRNFLKTYPESSPLRNDDIQPCQLEPCTNASLVTLKASDKVDMRSESIIEEETEELLIAEIKEKSTSTGSSINTKCEEEAAPKEENEEDNNIITVNIYTVEDSPTPAFSGNNKQEYFSQSNLRIMEKKIKRLQQENLTISKQNMDLKRKLKEISLELEKYISNSSNPDFNVEETKEVEMLREQVAYLRHELETYKMLAMDQEENLTEENLLIREELTKTFTSLNDWHVMANDVFSKIKTANRKLEEIGVATNLNLELDSLQNPKDFGNIICSYLEETFRTLYSVKDETFLYVQALRDAHKGSSEAKEISGLDQVISGYSELIEQCRKGQITGDSQNKVMEDYFAVIMEKASLMEEVKILKTENEMLLESQMEHYEKLKQTMIALKDRKSEITALESSQKLSEDKKIRLAEVLNLCEEEKKQIEAQLLEKGKAIEDLIRDLKEKELEIQNYNEKLKIAESEIINFEKSCRVKDEVINKLKTENGEHWNADEMKNKQIELLKTEIQNLEMQNNHLEAELNSAKIFLNNSQKETTDYITHLEGLVNTSQDSLEKNKQKLKEANHTIIRLKNECDVLEKQHQCDVKLFNNTKDDLELCKEKLVKISNKLKETEIDHEKWRKKYEFLADSDKQKLEALESLTKEYKITIAENDELREKVKIYSKDKEELLSEQKELINKYGLLSKEIQKLQEKYRSVKTECNERTDLIRYMEMMLKDNFIEYNNRIAGLERSISQIVEKIVAYKNDLKGKFTGEDPEVKELRHQLSITCQERKELENVIDNYYSLMKHLEKEIEEREKKVDELHVKLTWEQQKAVEYENQKSFQEDSKIAEESRIKQMENQIADAESKLAECKRELQRSQTNHENEKKKLQLTIADLTSEVKKYQLRTEVMLRNLAHCNKNMTNVMNDKRKEGDSGVQLKKELEEKEQTILELVDRVNKYKAEIKLKDDDLENFKKKNFYQNEELKNLQNKIAKLLDTMSTANKTTESQQKERDEMAEKLIQSIKLIMEEKSTRQTIESLALEKEKNYKNQIDRIKNELVLKVKECETLSEKLEDKKKLVAKLQNDMMKIKVEVATLKVQVSNYKKRNYHSSRAIKKENELLHQATSIQTPKKVQDRLESYLKELKEIRDYNLELRKAEGQYQAKIVRLEEEIRDARLLIKELQGDIKTEKKSKKAFKNMICAAKMEIEKCVMSKQLISAVAERINRHLDLSEISSRELLSGFRLNDSSLVCT